MRRNVEGRCCVLTTADLLQRVSHISVVTTADDKWMSHRMQSVSTINLTFSVWPHKKRSYDARIFQDDVNKTLKHLSQYIRRPGVDINPAPPDYKSRALPL